MIGVKIFYYGIPEYEPGHLTEGCACFYFLPVSREVCHKRSQLVASGFHSPDILVTDESAASAHIHLQNQSNIGYRPIESWEKEARTFLSTPVPMHGGLLCIAFCMSVCLSLDQKFVT